MANWTPEACDYLDGYLRQVGASARQQGDDADEIVSELREHITREVEADSGDLVTLDALRRTLLGIGTPEQVTGIDTPLAPSWRERRQSRATEPRNAPPSVAPVASQTVKPKRGCLTTVVLGVGVLGIVYIAVFVGIAILGTVAAVTLPALSSSRESANRAACANNLKRIGVALRTYAEGHGGKYPDSFVDISDFVQNDPKVFICPATRGTPGSAWDTDQWSDYVYIPPKPNAIESSTVVCQEKTRPHEPTGCNELYLDGHVEYREFTNTRQEPPPAELMPDGLQKRP